TGKTAAIPQGPAQAAPRLAKVMKMPVSEVQSLITGKRQFAYVAKEVTPEVWRQVDALEIGGIHAERTTKRYYPAGRLAAPILGFVGRDGTPLGGLELQLKDRLLGKNGSITYQRDPAGRLIATTDIAETPAVPGTSFELTLDRDVQWQAEQLLAAKVAEAKAESGTAVVLTKTGAILALANVPSFDPNNAGAADAADLRNRALAEVYEPGSTSKVMTAAAALEEGVATPGESFRIADSIQRSGTVFNDSHPHATETMNLQKILAESSNVGTIRIGERLSPDVMYRYLGRFGMGQPSGLAFPGESRGILAQPKDWSGSQRYTIMFGQGMSVNALQVAGVYQTLANDGLRVPPSLVAATVDQAGQRTPARAAEPTRVISAATAKTMRVILESVVSTLGTAPKAQIPGYRVAGKTGTAERYVADCGCYRGYTSSFVGFAPADRPELIIAVTLQGPTRGRSGGELAAPVFRDLMSYALQKLKVPPTTAPSPKAAQSPDGR
ncbi:MAG: peptidoglycan D,D-transpeptidase FtsI family protein, partial [Angustibacter sp.]